MDNEALKRLQEEYNATKDEAALAILEREAVKRDDPDILPSSFIEDKAKSQRTNKYHSLRTLVNENISRRTKISGNLREYDYSLTADLELSYEEFKGVVQLVEKAKAENPDFDDFVVLISKEYRRYHEDKYVTPIELKVAASAPFNQDAWWQKNKNKVLGSIKAKFTRRRNKEEEEKLEFQRQLEEEKKRAAERKSLYLKLKQEFEQ